MPQHPPPRPVAKPPRPAIEKGPERRPGRDYRADPDSDELVDVVEVEPETPVPEGERRPSRVGIPVVVVESTTLRPPDTFPSKEPDTTSRILATTTAAEEAEAARAAEEMRRWRFNWRWLFQTKEGRFVLKLVATLGAGGTWSEIREPVLAFVGVASAVELRASEDARAKLTADLDTERRERRIDEGELQKQINSLTTTNTLLANELATIRGTEPLKGTTITPH